ncbi:uncharacterized protein [Halyomorpha halys]|uniref:uncharacterized protein n=1 Tax=Halyomorpha halys TaxID=286706 RepID=UPI0034D37561
MQCFPLALQQAVSYIKVQNMKLQNVGSHFNIACYLNFFKDNSKVVLNYSFPDDSYIDYTQTVYITWNVTLDLLRKSENGNEALKIMNILSYMDPEDIPIEIFLKLVNDYDVLSSALDILKQYSMITIHHKIISSEQQVGMINVHGLVQEVIRLKLVEDKEDRLILEEALQIFTRKNVNDRTLNHAMSVWDYSSKVDFFSEDIRRYCVWVSIYICSELLVNSRFMELNSFVQKAIESCNLLPKDDIIAQGCLLHLIHIKGGVLRILGKCKDSEESFQNVASHIETVYSKTLSLINKRDSAMTLIKQGNYNEAINILKETKTLLSPSVSSDSEEFLENVFDLEGKYECLYQSLNFSKEDDFIKTIDLGKKNIIALLYFQQGKYTEALKEFKELVDIGRNVLGENHPKILWFQTNIAKILREQAKLDEALKLLEEIYEKQKTVLGKDHLDTLETLFCKGEILEDQEKFNDSLRIYQEVLENRITKLGKDHQSSLKACTSIGNIFYKLKDYDKALERYNEVLSKSDNLDIIIKIGEIYFNKGEINRALVIFEDAMKVIQDKFGCDHYTYLFVSTHIAELYQKQGKYDLALEHYQNIFEIKKNELGENHPDCLFIKYNIAITLFLKKELNKSLEMSCELLGKMNGILGADHPQSLSVRNNISAILVLQDRLDEALQECKASIEIQKLNPERNGRNITVTKKILVDIFSKQNKHEEVLKLLTETLENQESVSHNNPLTIGDTKSEIALCLIRLNKPQRAIKFVRESFNIFKSVLGPEHPKTVIQSDLLQYLSPHCLFAAVTQKKTTEFIKELVTSGCDFDIQDDEGRTLLHHAVNQGNIETVKYLLSIGVDVTQVTEKGNSCLHVAVLKGNRDVVKVLLQYSSHFRLKEFIDIRTNLRGMAALHVASINDNLDLVRTLLNHGAKYNILNNDTKRPIDLAKDKEVKSILKLVEINFNLVSWGSIKADELNALKEEDLVAMVNARNENGQTLLQHAISKSDKISAQRLLEILQKMKVI